MSLPALADSAPDPALLEQFSAPAGVPKAVRRRADFFVFFAQTVYPRLAQYRPVLAPLYCPHDGRPALEPIRLLGVLILQFVERLPDRQAAEAMRYDSRWRLALHLSAGEAACDPSLLSVFRDRLVAGGQERLAFEAVLALLVAEGWVPQRSKQRLDSTHVGGIGLDEPAGMRAGVAAAGPGGGGRTRGAARGVGVFVGAIRRAQSRSAQRRRDPQNEAARGRRGYAPDLNLDAAAKRGVGAN